MKRRIRIIFWLMTCCIVGINGFQAYWLYTTWQLTHQQFARDAYEALSAVGQQEQQAFSDYFVLQAVLRQQAAARVPARRPPPPTAADTAQLAFYQRITDGWKLHLPRLAQRYRHELHLRGITANFQLDTLRLRDPPSDEPDVVKRVQMALDLLPGRLGGLKVSSYSYKWGKAGRSARHLPAADSVSRAAQVALPTARGEFRTAPVLLLRRNLYVQARFPTPTFYLLRRMGGLLAGSVLLLALTTGCFGLMLTTILRQKKLSDIKNDFINNMTHELKTPLATVSAAVEALQNFGALQDPAKTAHYLRISRDELHRLAGLVDQVLRIAVTDRQPLTLAPEPVRPAELVAEVVARHRLPSAAAVRFDIQLAPDAPPVRLDRLHMGNVLNNLIDNAIKYAGGPVVVRVQEWHAAGAWHLAVADNGPGIAPAYHAAVFERFFRVPTGNLHHVRGFGLGLYYVRQVVEAHGGRVEVRSQPGQGSEFRLSIPQPAA